MHYHLGVGFRGKMGPGEVCYRRGSPFNYGWGGFPPRDHLEVKSRPSPEREKNHERAREDL